MLNISTSFHFIPKIKYHLLFSFEAFNGTNLKKIWKVFVHVNSCLLFKHYWHLIKWYQISITLLKLWLFIFGFLSYYYYLICDFFNDLKQCFFVLCYELSSHYWMLFNLNTFVSSMYMVNRHERTLLVSKKILVCHWRNYFGCKFSSSSNISV